MSENPMNFNWMNSKQRHNGFYKFGVGLQFGQLWIASALLILASVSGWGQAGEVSGSVENTADAEAVREDISQQVEWTLEEALAHALEGNRQWRAAGAKLEEATGVSIQTRALLWPKLKAEGQIQEFDSEQWSGASVGLQFPDTLWTGSVRVVQSVFEGGQLWTANRMARLTRQQAYEEYNQAMSELILSVRLAYWEVLLTQKQVELIRGQYEALQKKRDTMALRFGEGQIRETQYKQFDVNLARMKPRLLKAENDATVARQKFFRALGMDLAQADVELTMVSMMEIEKLQNDVRFYISEAMSYRSDTRALEKAVEKADLMFKNAKSGYLPSAQVFAGYGGLADHIGREWRGPFVGLQAQWELWDGGATRGKRKQARAASEQARLQLEDALAMVEIDVQTNYSSATQAWESYQAMKEAEKLAEETLQLTRLEEEQGVASVLEVTQARQALLDIRISRWNTFYQYHAARARLDYAVGFRDVSRP